MNRMQMISRFPQFMNEMRGKDPGKMINDMISSGKISQEQYEGFKRQADDISAQLSQFRRMFGFRK